GWTSDGIEIVRLVGNFDPAAFAKEERTAKLYPAIGASITDLDQTGLTQAVRYRIHQGEKSIELRQGPRSLLRYNLRTQAGLGLSNNGGQSRTQSKALAATIAGEQRTVWLIETSTEAMLVFEIDDLLVHILASDAELLEQSVLPALSKLKWIDPVTTPLDPYS
ncbi:MAG TPA: hypothetical protein VGD69_15045, partial [Herpetosiphonaceae bacterium]